MVDHLKAVSLEDAQEQARRENEGSNPFGRLITTDQWPEQQPAPAIQLVKGLIELGQPHLTAMSGGVGKTHGMLDLAVKVTLANFEDRGRYWMGHEILHGGRAVVVCSEDTEINIQRRLWALYPGGEWRNSKLTILPLISMKLAHLPFWVKSNGVFIQTPQWKGLCERIGEINGVSLVSLDPAQKMSALNLDQDNADAQFVGTSVGELAEAIGCATMTNHHMNKTAAEIETAEQARQAIRGATAMVDAHRLAFAAWEVKGDDGRRIIDQLALDCEPRDIVRSIVVKTNLTGIDMKLHTLLRYPDGSFGDITNRVEKGIQQRKDGTPEMDVYANTVRFLRDSAANGAYYTRTQLREAHEKVGCGQRRLSGFIAAWISEKNYA